MVTDVFVHLGLLQTPLPHAKQVNRHHFLIGRARLRRVVAPALILEFQMFIVHLANPDEELNQLKFYFHTSTLQRWLGLRFYP